MCLGISLSVSSHELSHLSVSRCVRKCGICVAGTVRYRQPHVSSEHYVESSLELVGGIWEYLLFSAVKTGGGGMTGCWQFLQRHQYKVSMVSYSTLGLEYRDGGHRPPGDP